MSVHNDTLRLFEGRYVFHLHTSQTDGRLTVKEYFELARAHGIERLIFLEHIRRNPSYDVEAFIESIRQASDEFGIEARVGFEAKVLPGGELDIADEHAEAASVLGIAEHGFPHDEQLLIESLRECFERYAEVAREKNVVWVHPGLRLKRFTPLEDRREVYLDLIRRAWELGIAVERNLRYRLVPADYLNPAEDVQLVIGADAHSRREFVDAATQRKSSR